MAAGGDVPGEAADAALSPWGAVGVGWYSTPVLSPAAVMVGALIARTVRSEGVRAWADAAETCAFSRFHRYRAGMAGFIGLGRTAGVVVLRLTAVVQASPWAGWCTGPWGCCSPSCCSRGRNG